MTGNHPHLQNERELYSCSQKTDFMMLDKHLNKLDLSYLRMMVYFRILPVYPFGHGFGGWQ